MSKPERHFLHGVEYGDDPRFAKARRYMGRKAIVSETSRWVSTISVVAGGYLAAVGWNNDNSLPYYAAGASAFAAGKVFKSYARRRESAPDVIEKDARCLSSVLPVVKTDGESAANVLKKVSGELTRARFGTFGRHDGGLNRLLNGYSQDLTTDTYEEACRSLHDILWHRSNEADAPDDVVVASKMTRLTKHLAAQYRDLSLGQHIDSPEVDKYAAKIEILDKRLPLDEESGFDSWGTYVASILDEEALSDYVRATSKRIDSYIENIHAA